MGSGERRGGDAGQPPRGAALTGERLSRLVVKVGTSTLTDAQGRLDRAFIADLTAQLAAQRAQGRDVLLVTSGAIRAGRERLASRLEPRAPSSLPPPPSASLPYKQAAAALGQGLLIHTYTEAFAWRGVDCAQVLLTRDDLGDRRRFLNARNTLVALLSLGVIPVINENDTVAVDEIKFGDNDTLAALVATLVEADLLLILSDVEGLYEQPPLGEQEKETGADAERQQRFLKAKQERKEEKETAPGAEAESGEASPRIIRTVACIDETIAALAGDSASGVGTGGMRTKIEAARIAAAAGIRTVIAPGRRERVVAEILAGEEVGTTFLPPPRSARLPARKRWIAHGARPRGYVTVNAPAKEKLIASGVSLLAVGIVGVHGAFTSGDLIEVRDEAGQVFARGITNYAAAEVRRVLGLRSEQFEAVLGYRGFEEIIHRDNLVVDCRPGARGSQ
ncbi:MAG TPA: glutamate 5-kinase [Chthonomonadaceae bacterium]|nr:glutamate 5-kinase [Chthonomonadaceae bacterium]